jgi:hypothetical protein
MLTTQAPRFEAVWTERLPTVRASGRFSRRKFMPISERAVLGDLAQQLRPQAVDLQFDCGFDLAKSGLGMLVTPFKQVAEHSYTGFC